MSPGWRRRGPPAPFSGGTPGVALVTWKRACSRPHESPVFKAIDYGRLPKRDRRPDNRCVVTRLPFVHPIGAQALLSPVARRALANSEAGVPRLTPWRTNLTPRGTQAFSFVLMQPGSGLRLACVPGSSTGPRRRTAGSRSWATAACTCPPCLARAAPGSGPCSRRRRPSPLSPCGKV